MNSRRPLLLSLFVILFLGISAFVTYLRFRYEATHFRVGDVPREFTTALLPKTVPLAEMHPPALRAQDPVRYGSTTAMISVVEYGDFQCEYCRAMQTTIQQVLPSYQGKVRFVWRDNPLETHAEAVPAAVFARCAGIQGAFWGAYDALMQAPRLNASSYLAIADQLRLDRVALRTCQANQAVSALVIRDREEAQADGIRSAPLLFVGTKAIDGFIDVPTLRQIIDEQLSSL